MVADNAACVKGRHCDDVGTVVVGGMLTGTSKSGLQQPSVTQSGRTAVSGDKAVVDRENVAFLEPEQCFLIAH
jgi:hypothetical protein